jgi:hypothetical protein
MNWCNNIGQFSRVYFLYRLRIIQKWNYKPVQILRKIKTKKLMLLSVNVWGIKNYTYFKLKIANWRFFCTFFARARACGMPTVHAQRAGFDTGWGTVKTGLIIFHLTVLTPFRVIAHVLNVYCSRTASPCFRVKCITNFKFAIFNLKSLLFLVAVHL